ASIPSQSATSLAPRIAPKPQSETTLTTGISWRRISPDRFGGGHVGLWTEPGLRLMTHSAPSQGRGGGSRIQIAANDSVSKALSEIGPPLFFAMRLWASVCLAMYVAFWLQLSNPWWAGASAAVVCQPQLGASLRKGWFRLIGTVIGATMIVVITAWFPQDRIG